MLIEKTLSPKSAIANHKDHGIGGLGLIEPVDSLDLTYKKVRAYYYSQLLYTAYNSVGICDFVAPHGKLSLKQLIDYINALTGWDMSLSAYDQQKEFKNNFWYKNLPSQSAQALISKLATAWKSFFSAKKNGKLENPKPPKFKPKTHHSTVTFKRNNFKMFDNKIRLTIPKQSKEYLKEEHSIKSNYLWIDLDKSLSLDGDVKIVEIVPLWDGSYSVHVSADSQSLALARKRFFPPLERSEEHPRSL